MEEDQNTRNRDRRSRGDQRREEWFGWRQGKKKRWMRKQLCMESKDTERRLGELEALH